MSLLFGYFLNRKKPIVYKEITVSVAESVTAGALANTLCSEPGASKFFKGGVVVYSVQSKKDILGVDIDYSEKTNFANPFTTSEMAKLVAKKFSSVIGISTTGYSLPFYREENKELGYSELNVENPYAYICLYDTIADKEIIKKIDFIYEKNISDRIQRANVQTKVAIEARNLYIDYIKTINI